MTAPSNGRSIAAAYGRPHPFQSTKVMLDRGRRM